MCKKLLTALLFFSILSLSAQNQVLRLTPLTSADDAEEAIETGVMTLDSSDLELGGFDRNEAQITAVRFPNVTLPANAIVVKSYIQFSVDEVEANPIDSSILIKAQIGNATVYNRNNANISNRTYTTANAIWNALPWSTVGDRAVAQRTIDISNIITEATQTGFTNGDALAFTFTTNNKRGLITADTFDAGVATAPELVIEYLENPVPVVDLLETLVVNEVTGFGSLQNGSDWVELYNASNAVINLEGISISDKLDEPFKYVFANRLMAAKSTVLIETEGYFGIKDTGEAIYLFQTINETTVLLDTLEARPTDSNMSYGRKPDGAATIVNFNVASPGASNNTVTEAASLNFSSDRGVHTSAFALTLTTEPGVTIRYTTNSRRPSKTYGNVYNGPIQINNNTVIKAVAYNNNAISKVITHTYIITNNPAYQEAPIVSFSTTNVLNSKEERDCSIEYIDKYGEGTSTFADAGFYMYGNASVSEDKRNFRFRFRSQYGYSKFEHPIFEKRDVETYKPETSFNALELKSGQDATRSYGLGGTNMSEKIAHDYMREMGHVDVHARHVNVFINGNYHGVYSIREKFSSSFAEDYFGGDKEDYDYLSATKNVRSHWEDFPEVDNGSIAQWNELKSFATTNFQEIKARLEVDQFIDYMLLFFIGDFEWEYRTLAHRGYEKSKFRFQHNDYDGFIRAEPKDVAPYLNKLIDDASGEGPGKLFYLAGFGGSNLEYMTMVKDRVLVLFDENNAEGVLTERNFAEKTNNFRTQYRNYNSLEYSRWPQYTDSNEYESRVNDYLDYLPTRFATVRNFLLERGLMHTLNPVTLSVPEGMVTPGVNVTINNSNTGAQVYYALGGDDVVFDNAPSGTLYTAGEALPLIEGENIVKARAFKNGAFGPLTTVVLTVPSALKITGINYNPVAPEGLNDDDFEFLLFTNTGSENRNIENYTIGGIGFTFPSETVINAGETVMIARNETAYSTITYNRIIWTADAKLSNKGEKLTLKNAAEQTLGVVDYDDASPWPVEADGDGYYLRLKDNNLDNTIATNWEAVITEDEEEPTLSVIKEAQVDTTKVYPNPVCLNETLHFKFNNVDALKVKSITFISLQGQTLYKTETSAQFFKIKTSNILQHQGLYFVTITVDNKTLTHKLLIK